MKKRKILIIDDEEVLCKTVKLNLEDTGKYEVVFETKGKKGLDAAKKHKPELIILDFRIPDMHGSEVAQALQKDAETKQIPIIFLTGLATKEELADHGDEELCNLVLAKPATTKEIDEAIENNIGKQTSLFFLANLFDEKRKIRWK